VELKLISKGCTYVHVCSQEAEGHGVVVAMLRVLLFSVNTDLYPYRISLQELIVNYRLGNIYKLVFEITCIV